MMQKKKEFGCYVVSGGITTLVNYVIYTALLFMHVAYLPANGISWVGSGAGSLCHESEMGVSLP